MQRHVTYALEAHRPLAQRKLETMRQEETVQQNLEAQDATHGRLIRSVSTVRLAIDAERADMMDSEV